MKSANGRENWVQNSLKATVSTTFGPGIKVDPNVVKIDTAGAQA